MFFYYLLVINPKDGHFCIKRVIWTSKWTWTSPNIFSSDWQPTVVLVLNGHIRFINGHDFFRKCFHLMGSNKLYYVDIIIFLIYYLIPLCLSNVKRPKNGHHGPKNGHFGFENHHGSFWKYFHLIGSKKLY